MDIILSRYSDLSVFRSKNFIFFNDPASKSVIGAKPFISKKLDLKSAYGLTGKGGDYGWR
jgi:hypothetical protein